MRIYYVFALTLPQLNTFGGFFFVHVAVSTAAIYREKNGDKFIASTKREMERKNSHNCGWWRHKVDLFQGRMTKWLAHVRVDIARVQMEMILLRLWPRERIWNKKQNKPNPSKKLMEMHLIALCAIQFGEEKWQG